MKLLKEPGQHSAHVSDDFVRMGAHQAARVHDHAEALKEERDPTDVDGS
jgi:uncharacterized protein YmfQ (DUF2313 family)